MQHPIRAFAHKNILLTSLLLSASTLVASNTAAQSNDVLQDVITVYGSHMTAQTQDNIKPETEPVAAPDAAAFVARLPGADINNNGQLSGQVQYRGLFGPRINVQVDGNNVMPGGPGWMDPPLHYAPMPLVARIQVDRGVSPVRNGPGLAGGVNAVFKKANFGETSEFNMIYDISAGYRSVDDSTSVGGIVGTSNDVFRINALYARENGDNIKFPGGEIASSEHVRLVYGLSTGVKLGSHELGLDIRKQETGNSGNPPFPMDIRFFDFEFANAFYKGDFDAFRVEAKLGAADISHGMTNFHLRPNSNPMAHRETFAKSFRRTAEIMLAFDLADGELKIGSDYDFTKNKSRITHPNNQNFFLDNVPIVRQDRTGVFGEWTGALGGINAEIGGRVDWIDSDIGQASVGAALPMGPVMLANMFNISARTWSDTNIDTVLRLWRETDGPITWRGTLAHKTRTPGYLDRFAWLPTTASAGLADGNIYLGDPSIVSENAWILNGGLDYQSKRAYARPTIFYRSVNDYIQGVPFDNTVGVIDTLQEMVAAGSGDPTPLKFGNVDAELYGFDMDFGMKLMGDKSSGLWRMDGVASYVRGKRRDIDDNLYRVSPPNLTLSGTYERQGWSVSLESKFVATQNNVSLTNSELATDGFALFNLHGQWDVKDSVMISAGVENLLNKHYAQHLSGYNRISGSDVMLGDRLPGSGRGVFVKLSLRN